MLLTIVNHFVELLRERPEDQTKLMETEFFRFPSKKADHMVILHLSATSEVIDVFRSDVSLITDIDKLEKINQIKVIILGQIFS